MYPKMINSSLGAHESAERDCGTFALACCAAWLSLIALTGMIMCILMYISATITYFTAWCITDIVLFAQNDILDEDGLRLDPM